MKKTLPLSKKLNGYRKNQAKYFYRKAGIEFGSKNMISFVLNLLGAMLLQPRYTIKKLINQRIRIN